MNITKAAALEILERERKVNPDRAWLQHSMCVGEAAERIATSLKCRDVAIDPERAAALGFLHDIGKCQHNGFVDHMWSGYNYLKNLGYDDEVANICLTHSFMDDDNPICTIGTQIDQIENAELVEFLFNYSLSLEERLVALCDAMCTETFLTVEQRLVDVVSRHGTNPGTQQAFLAAMRLKHEFDELLGDNIYTLFPEIRL